MNKALFRISLLVIFLVPARVFSQDTEKPSLNSGSLDSQFEYVITKSSPYLEFRVVEEAWLKKLNSHVNDSIEKLRSELSEYNSTILKKDKDIQSLKLLLENTKEELNNSRKEKNSLNFFGILMSKAAYNSLMFLIIAILTGALVILIIAFKRSHVITANTRQDLENTLKEFEEHRTRTRLREEKIVREYHYELNKYKNS